MITDADITKLKTVFATKKELYDVKDGVGDLRVEVGEIKDTVQRMEITLDKVAGVINDLWTENATGAVHLARHDRQIQALATHTNIVLPE